MQPAKMAMPSDAIYASQREAERLRTASIERGRDLDFGKLGANFGFMQQLFKDGQMVTFSAPMAKLSRKGRAQERLLCVTPRYVYNVEAVGLKLRTRYDVAGLEYIVDLEAKQGLALKFAQPKGAKTEKELLLVFSTAQKTELLEVLSPLWAEEQLRLGRGHSVPTGLLVHRAADKVELRVLLDAQPALRETPVALWYEERNVKTSARDRLEKVKAKTKGVRPAGSAEAEAGAGAAVALAAPAAGVGREDDLVGLGGASEVAQQLFLHGDAVDTEGKIHRVDPTFAS